MENYGARAGTTEVGRTHTWDPMGLSYSQRQHQGTEKEEAEQDSGGEEKGDISRCCDFQLQFAQNHRPGPHPQRLWEKRKGTMREDAVRE